VHPVANRDAVRPGRACFAEAVKEPSESSLERRLRASALSRQRDCADPELSSILSLVARRRGQRASTSSAAPGTVLEVTASGPEIVIVRVARPLGFTFEAGQAVKLGFGDGQARPYTIASPPQADSLEFCIERIAGGSLSPRLTSVQPGARIQVAASAKGSLTRSRSASVLVMLATATGVAPFRSMLLELLSRPLASQRAVLLHGSSYHDRLPYAEELAKLARLHSSHFTYVPTISRPGEPRNAGWSGQVGRIDTLLPSLLASVAGGSVQTYACGNSGMIDAVRRVAEAQGLPLASEAFD
jgi:ferredoxin-NADP reductase